MGEPEDLECVTSSLDWGKVENTVGASGLLGNRHVSA